MIHVLSYEIADVKEYINWSYFFHAWGFAHKYSTIADYTHDTSDVRRWINSFTGKTSATAPKKPQICTKTRQNSLPNATVNTRPTQSSGFLKQTATTMTLLYMTKTAKQRYLAYANRLANKEQAFVFVLPIICGLLQNKEQKIALVYLLQP